jgi:serine/threonine-protein kinase RsbW
LTVPGELRYRDLAVRTVAAACRLVGTARQADAAPSSPSLDLHDRFDAELISAFSEIFNNIAIHAYESLSGDVDIVIEPSSTGLVVTVTDRGTPFDPSLVPAPELDSLPEGGMGIHIARACVDQLDYTAGPPNVWRLAKLIASESTGPSSPRSRASTSQG